MSNKSVAVMISLCLLGTGAMASDAICKAHINEMAADALYAACDGSSSCLFRIKEKARGGTSLPSGSYRILYRPTRVSPATNSVIVLQRKYFEDAYTRPASEEQLIYLRRERVPFGCDGPLPASPNVEAGTDYDPDSEALTREMNYDTYDEYTRSWKTNDADTKYLRAKFHFQYRNGYDARCVSTRDAAQRRWFLLNDRNRISGPGGSVVARLNLSPVSPAQATEQIRVYKKLRLNVFPYTREAAPSTVCLSFPVDSTSFDGVDVGVFDLEEAGWKQRQGTAVPEAEWRVTFTKTDK